MENVVTMRHSGAHFARFVLSGRDQEADARDIVRLLAERGDDFRTDTERYRAYPARLVKYDNTVYPEGRRIMASDVESIDRLPDGTLTW